LAWLGLNRVASLHLLTLLSLVLVSGLSVVYLTHRDRVLFNELQKLRDEANELDVQWGQLLIEQSTLGVGGRVEQRATEVLEMRVPEIEKIVMVINEQAGK
jgi:cell division protein FtsL